jgi:hypothetical protein
MRPPGREGVITAAIAREVSACLVILRLLAIGIRGARLAAPGRARVARTARLIVGCLAWLSIPLWVLVMGRAHCRGRPPDPRNRRLSKGSMIMRTAYRVIAYLLALSVAVQASLIAFGAFALENNIDNGPVSDGDTTGVTLHHSFAYVVVLFAVALLAVSFGAKVQHGVRWAAIPLGLVVVQFFLAYAAYSAAIVGVLHGLNALAIFAMALLAGRRVPKAAPVAELSATEEALV